MNPSIAEVIRKYTRLAYGGSDPFAGKKFNYRGKQLALSTIEREDPVEALKIRQRLHHENRNHRSVEVRQHIATHRNTHSDTLHEMRNDKNATIRKLVTRHPGISCRTLHAVRNDKNTGVRWNVATHSNVHPDTLHAMRNDKDSSIRRAISNHPETTKSTLHEMRNDKDLGVRRNVARRLKEGQVRAARIATPTSHQTTRVGLSMEQELRNKIAQQVRGLISRTKWYVTRASSPGDKYDYQELCKKVDDVSKEIGAGISAPIGHDAQEMKDHIKRQITAIKSRLIWYLKETSKMDDMDDLSDISSQLRKADRIL